MQEEFMTIDERLDRLTGRHETLTQSVELLLRESQEQTRQINEHTRQVGALRDASAALLKIAQTDENRISGWKASNKIPWRPPSSSDPKFPMHTDNPAKLGEQIAVSRI
jgi:hypothetical protein